ncbi:hypothetical protein BG005_009967 [Podila minutissima]|nr:hypothetical protein BG005_009967 [Podila minutissima]
METVTHPIPRDLLPAELSALIQSAGATHGTSDLITTSTTPALVQAQLGRIPRSTWLHLGADCHNKSFAIDLAATQASAPAPKGFMASLKAKEIRVTLDSGLPQIIQTIQRRSQTGSSEKEEETEEGEEKDRTPSLWTLYNFCKAVFSQQSTSSTRTAAAAAPQSTKELVSKSVWQLQFIKSGCPEVVVAAVLDLFLQQGLRQGFDWAISQELVEVIDHELRSSHPTAKKAVQALVQTMISSWRFVKTSSGAQQIKKESKGLGLMDVDSTTSTPGQDNSTEEDERKARREKECFQLASSLSDAYLALEAYLETEMGKTLPKLVALFNQEIAADTKAKSRAGGERGTKRPGGLGGIGGGPGASSGQDALDLAKKKQKLTNENPGGSSSSVIGSSTSTTYGSDQSTGTATNSRQSILVEASGFSPEQIAMLTRSSLKTTAHYLDQAQLGYNTPIAGLGVSTSTQSTLQQAKVNNPLWSPALGLNYSPQQQAKYGALVVNEIERWMALLGHMDGAVFSERLVGLIKAVYPSDQKFLLDQILIEAMSLESKDFVGTNTVHGGQDHLEDVDPKTVLLASLATPFGSHTEIPQDKSVSTQAQLAQQTKTREWLTEMIMSALIGLVIKPEDSAAWIEPGTTKWAEPVELCTIISEDNAPGSTNDPDASSTAAGGASSSSPSAAAMGKNKKRRLRSLYNRRVSPFYATLAIFQQKKISARMSGMYYLTPEDLVVLSKDTSDALLEQRKQQELLLQQQQELLQQAKMMRRHKDIDLDDPNLAALKGSRNKRNRNRFKSQKRKEERSGRQGSQGGQGGQGGQGAQGSQGGGDGNSGGKFMDGGVYREGSMAEALSKLKDDSSKAGTESVMSAENEATGGDMSSSLMVPDPESESVVDGGDTKMSHAHDEDREQGHEDAEKSKEQEDIDDPSNHGGWMGGFTDDQALALAKEAGAGRQTCNAPFRVLMLVLKHLTRMNLAGALDAWISDAVSGTVPALQVRYFEWLLSHLVPISAVLPKPEREESMEAGVDSQQPYHQRQIRAMKAIQDEVWRLVKVLVAAPGIGHDPAKAALAHVTARVPLDKVAQNGDECVEQEPGFMMETDTGGEAGQIWSEVRQLLLATETTDAPAASTSNATGPSA